MQSIPPAELPTSPAADGDPAILWLKPAGESPARSSSIRTSADLDVVESPSLSDRGADDLTQHTAEPVDQVACSCDGFLLHILHECHTPPVKA